MFQQRRRRKTHPCLFFERKASSNGTFPCTSDSVSKKQSKQQTSENESETEHNDSNAILLEQIKVSRAMARAVAAAMSTKRKRSHTIEEMTARRENIVRTLNQRRDAVCKEIERSWFVEGAYLEKHRHNLQVTHELEERGLMWP